MAGFNLPPGCRVSDIPGHEASEEEQFFDHVCDILGEFGVLKESIDAICERLLPLINEARRDSYNDGASAPEITIDEFLMGRDIAEVSPTEIINTFGSSGTSVSKFLVGLAKRIPNEQNDA